MSVVVAACGGGDDGGGTNTEDVCNPIDGTGCLLPWPSAVYLDSSTTSETGFQVNIPEKAMPVNVDGIPIAPTIANRMDGFSMTGPMLASFATGVSADGLPSYKNPDESLAADSPIIVLDLDTGERAPFFAEVDMNTTDLNARNLIIRPLMRLHEKSHYGVIITTKVKAADGSAIVPNEKFVALRDGGTFGSDARSKLAKDGWDAISAKLPDLSLTPADVALAWDFRTASDKYMRRDLTAMREQALPMIGDAGANLSFSVAMTLPNSEKTFKKYTGTYKAPNFLSNGEADTSIIVRDADDVPMANGLRDARFAAIIPKCASDGSYPLPRPVIIFGHGLFGSGQEYLDDDFTQKLAQDFCFVIVAGDFIGMTSRQIQLAPLAVNDMNRAPQIAEKLAQSVIDFMSLESLARGAMATAPEFQIDGHPVIDPTQVHYVGGSLGGIMGNVIMAYDPNFKKAVLAVPGGVWSLLLERSAAWFALLGAAQGAYDDPHIYQLMVAQLGLALEPYDPITTAAHVIKDPLFGQQPKKVLMWYSLGDSLVTNISTEFVLREMNQQVIAPSVRTPWRVPVVTPSVAMTSGVTVYDEHPTPLPPETNQPPKTDNGTHGGVNQNPSALRQTQEFLLDNMIEAECKNSGSVVACDCNVDGGGVCD
ncbi:MAG TPA: hypothetical protein VGM39_16535 [Kofleriaceae bacterium]